jgi:hypothetical protein
LALILGSTVAEPGKSMLVDDPMDDDVEMESAGQGEEQDSLIKDMVTIIS